jgi:hypothetical protein
MFNEN